MTDPPAPERGRARRRILVVDDDAPIRALLVRALTRTGHAIEAAADGEEALHRIAEARPDVVVLDLMMPRVDGFGVLQAVRADPAHRATQIVVITARAGREALEAAFAAGADDYVGKPFDLAELVARVEAQLRIVTWREALDRRRRDGEILLDISHRLTRRLDVEGILQDITALVADVLGTDRCSVVLVDDDPATGRVVAASDDAGLTDHAIALADYPEIRQVITTGAPLVVADIGQDPLFDPVKERLARLDIRQAALFPLLDGPRCFGVLFLRATRRRDDFGERETWLGTLVANATAIAITNARLFRELAAREKLTALAEIAGAAAHELNQPLQSVMGYAELLQRHLAPDDALGHKAAATIHQQATRMADIVRRIGRLTRYETRPYIGDERILDLVASAPDEPPGDAE